MIEKKNRYPFPCPLSDLKVMKSILKHCKSDNNKLKATIYKNDQSWVSPSKAVMKHLESTE